MSREGRGNFASILLGRLQRALSRRRNRNEEPEPNTIRRPFTTRQPTDNPYVDIEEAEIQAAGAAAHAARYPAVEDADIMEFARQLRLKNINILIINSKLLADLEPILLENLIGALKHFNIKFATIAKQPFIDHNTRQLITDRVTDVRILRNLGGDFFIGQFNYSSSIEDKTRAIVDACRTHEWPTVFVVDSRNILNLIGYLNRRNIHHEASAIITCPYNNYDNISEDREILDSVAMREISTNLARPFPGPDIRTEDKRSGAIPSASRSPRQIVRQNPATLEVQDLPPHGDTGIFDNPQLYLSRPTAAPTANTSRQQSIPSLQRPSPIRPRIPAIRLPEETASEQEQQFQAPPPRENPPSLAISQAPRTPTPEEARRERAQRTAAAADARRSSPQNAPITVGGAQTAFSRVGQRHSEV